MRAKDLVELELRLLPHVSFVGFADRSDVLVVQVLTLGTVDIDTLRHQAERICRAHLDGDFVVELSGGTRPARIRLLDVRSITPERSHDDEMALEVEREVEVHLAFEGVRTVGRAPGDDPTAAAVATFEALQQLGASVPFGVDAAALFEHVAGEGVMIVLGSDRAGQRYGVAAGSTVWQASARATLHALNRYLSTQSLPIPVPAVSA